MSFSEIGVLNLFAIQSFQKEIILYYNSGQKIQNPSLFQSNHYAKNFVIQLGYFSVSHKYIQCSSSPSLNIKLWIRIF